MINKRALAAVAAVILCASCEVDHMTQEALTMETLTIQAVFADDLTGARSKTVISDENTKSVVWTPGDKISLFYGSGTNGGSLFTSANTENATVTNFTGRIGVITGGADVSVDQTFFWGLYPYDSTASCDGSSIVTTLASEQTAVPGTFASGTTISVGRSQNLGLSFYNVCTGLRVKVVKEGVVKMTLKSQDGSPLAGKARIGINAGGVPEIQEIIEGVDEIVLKAPPGEYLIPGENYYFMFFPHNFSESFFTVTFETLTEEATYERTRPMNFARSNIEGFNVELDRALTYDMKTGNIPIPDPNFKTYLVANFDTDHDGEISYVEAQTVNIINVKSSNITSLSGIEYMTGLWSLNCEKNQLTQLNIGYNAALGTLSCGNNQLTSLDISNNTALIWLHCQSNQLTSLDVSNNTALQVLTCSSNQLTSLNVSNNTALTFLYCYSNQLTSLDVSNNTALTDLHCDSNQLTSLDVSNNTALTSLYCYSNQLTSLDVSNNTALTSLYCYSNQLTSLDVSNNTALNYLRCSSNQLTSLDISNNTALTFLYCYSNQLTSLDVSNNTALILLHCHSNQLTSLDVSNNTALTELACSSNQLTSLDVSNNTALNYLWCSSNQLTSLDVSNNTALTNLSCVQQNDSYGNNYLQTLYVAESQVIPNINDANRNNAYIPATTTILAIPPAGGGEGYGGGEQDP